MSLEILSGLKKELENNIIEFQSILKESKDEDSNHDNSIEGYESRINSALLVQHKASYILSVIYRLLNLTKPMFKQNRVGSDGYTKVKCAYDELISHFDYYKGHVYTYSQRAKTLCELLKIKQMASPDSLRS